MEQTRRGVLAAAGSMAAASVSSRVFAGWEPAQRYPDPAVEILDPSFAKYRLALASVERVATGFRWAEGPVWFGDMHLLLFSDVSNDRTPLANSPDWLKSAPMQENLLAAWRQSGQKQDHCPSLLNHNAKYKRLLPPY